MTHIQPMRVTMAMANARNGLHDILCDECLRHAMATVMICAHCTTRAVTWP